jgi:hypothetical protein
VAHTQVVPLASAYGQARIETGLVIMRDSVKRIFRPAEAALSETAWFKSVAYHHEWIHYLQSITCASVHSAAQRILMLAAEILAAGPETPDALHREFKALNEEIYGRRWDGGERIRIYDRPGQTIIEPLQIPESHELGMLDLLEGVAVLESFKLCTEGATVQDFLRFRDDYFPGELRDPYRWTFNWLGSVVGPEAAYELLAPVSYVSLQSRDPAADFVRLCERLPCKESPLRLREFTEPARLLELLGAGEWTTWLTAYEGGEPDAGHVTLDPGIAAAVADIGSLELARIGALPSRVQPEQMEVLDPPLTVFAGDGALQFILAPYTNDKLASSVLATTALVGAAERLTMSANVDVYQFCPQMEACPHYYSALCHRYLHPPRAEVSWESCSFIELMQRNAGHEPATLWAAAGRGRLTMSELVAVFEAAGQMDIAAVCRRQRQSLVLWLGEASYRHIAEQCDMVADQTLRALRTDMVADQTLRARRTRQMDHLIKAEMFRNTVVEQIRRLAAGAEPPS